MLSLFYPIFSCPPVICWYPWHFLLITVCTPKPLLLSADIPFLLLITSLPDLSPVVSWSLWSLSCYLLIFPSDNSLYPKTSPVIRRPPWSFLLLIFGLPDLSPVITWHLWSFLLFITGLPGLSSVISWYPCHSYFELFFLTSLVSSIYLWSLLLQPVIPDLSSVINWYPKHLFLVTGCIWTLLLSAVIPGLSSCYQLTSPASPPSINWYPWPLLPLSAGNPDLSFCYQLVSLTSPVISCYPCPPSSQLSADNPDLISW